MDPGTPVNGRKVSFSLAIGSNIEYECFTGYRLVGQQTITCLAGETWSHPVPTCESESAHPVVVCLLLIPTNKIEIVRVSCEGCSCASFLVRHLGQIIELTTLRYLLIP